MISQADFDILLFAPHLPAQGAPARAHFTTTHLAIDGQAISAPLENIGVTLGGFDHKQLYLFWHQEDGRWAISPRDKTSREALINSAPAPLDGLLKDASRDIRKQGHLFRMMLVLLALLILIPALLTGLFFWHFDRIAGWAADHVSIEQEKQLGEQAFNQATSKLHLRESGRDWQTISSIGQRLTSGSKYTYHWYVADDPSINAFAIPGGYVVVNTGLIKAADSAEEVAGVLAHEMQHVEQRHTLKNMIHALSGRAVLSLALGDASGSMIASAAANLGELKYSRALESEADIGALKALKKAGISPQGMVSFFSKLAKQDGSGITFLSTHPASAQRMQRMQEAINAEGPWPSLPLPYDWSAIKASSP
jgi:Zn-dependent protease with chaperone function